MVRRGEQFRLDWNVIGAANISIDHSIGAVGPVGNRILIASTTATYTLTASGKGGASNANATVVVTEPPKPEITEFRADPESIEAGGIVVLQWIVEHAEVVTLDGDKVDNKRGTRQVRPAATTTYLLRANNERGNALKDTTVQVIPPKTLSKARIESPPPKRAKLVAATMAGRLVRKTKPVYSQAAKDAQVQGPVQFKAIIGIDGRVSSLELLRGDPLLVPAASVAAKQYLYHPYAPKGRPVEVETTIQIDFVLPDR